MLNALIDKFQAKFPPNRLVALALAVLVPLAIVPAAGYIAVWVPAHLPGLPTFTAAQYTAFGVTGAGTALLAGATAAYKFIDGWQKHEGRKADAELKRLAQEHEKVLAVLRADNPEFAKSVLDDLQGGTPASDAVSVPTTAAPTAVVVPPLEPPPPPPTAAQTVPVPRPEPPPRSDGEEF